MCLVEHETSSGGVCTRDPQGAHNHQENARSHQGVHARMTIKGEGVHSPSHPHAGLCRVRPKGTGSLGEAWARLTLHGPPC